MIPFPVEAEFFISKELQSLIWLLTSHLDTSEQSLLHLFCRLWHTKADLVGESELQGTHIMQKVNCCMAASFSSKRQSLKFPIFLQNNVYHFENKSLHLLSLSIHLLRCCLARVYTPHIKSGYSQS